MQVELYVYNTENWIVLDTDIQWENWHFTSAASKKKLLTDLCKAPNDSFYILLQKYSRISRRNINIFSMK